MGIARKLWLFFGIVLLCYLATSTVGFFFSNRAGTTITTVREQSLPLNNQAKDALLTFAIMVNAYEKAALIEDADILDAAEQQAAAFHAQFSALTTSPSGGTLDQAASQWQIFAEQAPLLYQRYVVDSDYSDEVITGISTLRETVAPKIRQGLEQLAEQTRNRVDTVMADIDANNSQLNLITISGIVVLAIIAAALSKVIGGIRTSLSESFAALDHSQQRLAELATTLASSSERNLDQAQSIADDTDAMRQTINRAADAVEAMSDNTNSVSSASEELSVTMHSISTAVDDLNNSMSAVDGQAREGSTTAANGAEQAQASTKTMAVLADAARAINEVTNLIKSIADRTNLLALNATIEAATAGEAGRGFAVVAAEIKDLANQSATAADEINDRIQGIQSGTTDAITASDAVASVIQTLSTSTSAISAAMQTQTSTTETVAGNINEASVGIRDIAHAIGEISTGSNQVSQASSQAASTSERIAERIAGIRSELDETANHARKLTDAADQLQRVAGTLGNLL
ncbi:MAG: methyl-accepting chemotaxis protein [Planctomycetota bacterium]|jgi:methyl-accepting chemotaxis protein